MSVLCHRCTLFRHNHDTPVIPNKMTLPRPKKKRKLSPPLLAILALQSTTLVAEELLGSKYEEHYHFRDDIDRSHGGPPPKDPSVHSPISSERCRGLLQETVKHITCSAHDAFPFTLYQAIETLDPDECSRIHWAQRKLTFLLSVSPASALVALREWEDYWPSVHELLHSGESPVLFLLDCLRKKNYQAGIIGKDDVSGVGVQKIMTYETGGRERVERYGASPEFENVHVEDGELKGMDWKGDDIAQATLEYYVDKSIEERTASTKLNKIDESECVGCGVSPLIESSVSGGELTYVRDFRKVLFSQDYGEEYGSNSMSLNGTLLNENSFVRELEDVKGELILPGELILDGKETAERTPEEAFANVREALVYVVINWKNNAEMILKDLILALHCLSKWYPIPWEYDLLILYHGISLEEQQWLIDKAPKILKSRLVFIEMDESDVTEGDSSEHGKYGCQCPVWAPRCWDVAWMRATRVFTHHMFKYLMERSLPDRGNVTYDYFMRLDSDVFFIKHPPLDPIKMMIMNRCALAYNRLSIEAPGCFDKFIDYVDDFAEEHKLKDHKEKPYGKERLKLGKGISALGGQWTVGDMRLFSSPLYLRLNMP